MRVVIAEKPSVARDLARVLGAHQRHEGWLGGEGLAITWCFGHMAELEEPAHYNDAWRRWSLDVLPMLPERFSVKLRDGARDQFRVIEGLVRKASDVVNACDAGREGELIFRWVMEMTGVKAPVFRLWVSSLTDQAIQQGWSNLRPGREYDRLADAARSRSEADWLVGLNATRALTCKARLQGGGQLLSVGRVQTPTLAMIVARDHAIEAFVPENFWQVRGTFCPPGEPKQSFQAMWFREGADEPKGASEAKPATLDDDDEVDRVERLPDPDSAAAIVAATAQQPAVISSAERKRTNERPPLLYDLTSLQRRANQRYGLSADKTLALAQSLYEQHKLITYPRTDARYLTPDQVPLLPDVVRGLLPIPVYAPFASGILAGPIQPGPRVVNAAEVGDHHAILPTGRVPDASRLSADEKRVFDLVARRFLAVLSPDALFDVTRLVVHVAPGKPLPPNIPTPLSFRARGRVCRQEGWRAVDPPKTHKDLDLPPVDRGDALQTTKAEAIAGQTRPPRPHNDATLLQAMETAGRSLDDKDLARAMRGCGLGTPATRASILTVLVEREYVTRQGKDIRATDKGRALIEAVPIEALKSPELTGTWEGRLSDVADGKGDRATFMRDVRAWVNDTVSALAAAPLSAAAIVPKEDAKALGLCPACGQPVRERGPVYACDTGRSCPFVVFKTMAQRPISARLVTQLLKDGRSAPVKGFKSKAGKEFSASLEWSPADSKVRFAFEDRPAEGPPTSPSTKRDEPRRAKASSPKPKAPPSAAPGPGQPCPSCGVGVIMIGRTKLGCSRWREGCAWTAAPAATP